MGIVLTRKLLEELENRLKVGNRRGVHLNAIPGNSKYKFDIKNLDNLDSEIANLFIDSLLRDSNFSFPISWKKSKQDINKMSEEKQMKLIKMAKSFDNLVIQTEAIESEKGINTFGFGFPILYRRDEKDGKITAAPILIWQLKIKRSKDYNTWKIERSEDDPIYLNEVLINHIKSDSNIEIEKVSDEMLDDGVIDKEELIDICTSLINSINLNSPQDIGDIFNDKLKNIIPIRNKVFLEKLALSPTNSLIEFSGLFSIFEVQKQNIIKDYTFLKDYIGEEVEIDNFFEGEFQSLSSVRTDPSQQGILNSLESTKNILIQGPPGTGKSQSLTALLINALENKKKTIVVCEKRTALEVLHEALKKRGLDHHSVLLKDAQAGRRNAVNKVRERIEENKHYGYYSNENYLTQLKRAQSFIKEINDSYEFVSKTIFGNSNWPTLVAKHIRLKKSIDEEVYFDFKEEEFKYNVEEEVSLIALFDKGEKYYDFYKPLAKFSFLNSDKFNGDNPFVIEEDLKKKIKDYNNSLIKIGESEKLLSESYSKIRFDQFNITKEKIIKSFIDLKSLNKNALFAYSEFKKSIEELRKKFIEEQYESVYSICENIEILYLDKDSEIILNDKLISSTFFNIKTFFSKKAKSIKAKFISLNKLFNDLDQLLYRLPDIEVHDFSKFIGIQKRNEFAVWKNEISNVKRRLLDNIKNEVSWNEVKLQLFEKEISKLTSVFESGILNKQDRRFNACMLEQEIEFVNSIKGFIENLLFNWSMKNDKGQIVSIEIESREPELFSINHLLSYFNQLSSSIIEKERGFQDQIDTEKNNFLNGAEVTGGKESKELFSSLFKEVEGVIVQIKNDNWISVSQDVNNSFNYIRDTITKLINQIKSYLNSDEDYFRSEYNWWNFYNGLTSGLKRLTDQLYEHNSWSKHVFLNYINSFLLTNSSSLLPQDDTVLKELTDSLSSIEKEQKLVIDHYWVREQNQSVASFNSSNSIKVENLYNKKSSKNYSRLSLRNIVKFDIDLFSNFFPIILTTPDVASTLFQGNNEYFDLVLFDEASQLKLEDNLPSILKGKQVVIAGDEHQMPPSNYFSKLLEGGYDEDEGEDENDSEEVKYNRVGSLLECESLLEFGAELNFDKKFLDFHYRSNHPYLIDFSNYAFYNKRLKPLPCNVNYTPIEYYNVSGQYVNQENIDECNRVIEILKNEIQRGENGEYPSVGVATFNIQQRNTIISSIRELTAGDNRDENFANKIIELEEKGLFVKNLENIQGDERDVIILSTTYGRDGDGKFAQRFGPINQKKGYKLLNVIITRSKDKLILVTSIPEQVIESYKNELDLIGSNNKRAVFYAYLAYAKSVSENNEEKRIQILSDLEENSNNRDEDFVSNGELESPFEEEVYEELMRYFDPEEIVIQYKFAEFRIDLVFLSKNTNVPKIAIECDGKQYHSSKEAYLHDIHRQRILESKGFVFHRIWSTNWWRNYKKETSKLVDFIKSIESKY